MHISKAFILISTLVSVTVPASSTARVFSVGADSACSHRDIGAALEAARKHPGRDEVRLARNLRHKIVSILPVSDDVLLSGGFSSCSDNTAQGFTPIWGEKPHMTVWLSHQVDVRRLPVKDEKASTDGPAAPR